MGPPTRKLGITYVACGVILIVLGIIPLGMIGGYMEAHKLLDTVNETISTEEINYLRGQTSIGILIAVAAPIILVGAFSIPTGIKRSKSMLVLEMVAVIIGLIWCGFMTISQCIYIFTTKRIADTGELHPPNEHDPVRPVLTIDKATLQEFFTPIFYCQLVVTLVSFISWSIMASVMSTTCLIVFKTEPKGGETEHRSTEGQQFLNSPVNGGRLVPSPKG